MHSPPGPQRPQPTQVRSGPRTKPGASPVFSLHLHWCCFGVLCAPKWAPRRLLGTPPAPFGFREAGGGHMAHVGTGGGVWSWKTPSEPGLAGLLPTLVKNNQAALQRGYDPQTPQKLIPPPVGPFLGRDWEGRGGRTDHGGS